MSVGQFVTSDMVSSVLDRKDNTWLQLDVCPAWRETGNCPNQDSLCCHAHPPPHIEILESNRVVSCYDEVKKGSCKRKDCKFFHPPNHLKNVVNTNGRNNLRLRNELKAQFRALYGQSQASLPTYYSSYLPISYHLPAQPGAPAFLEGGQEETLSPPGELQHPQLDSRRRAFSPERLQSGSKYHPYYVVGGQLDRRAQPSNIHQRRMGPDQLQQTLPLVQSLPVGCSPHYYDNSHLLLPPGTPTPTLIYTNPAQGAWTIPTLTSSRDK